MNAIRFKAVLILLACIPLCSCGSGQTQSDAVPEAYNDLSNELYSYEFVLDNVVYKLPAVYSVFSQNGWVQNNREDKFASLYKTQSTPNSYIGELSKNGSQIPVVYGSLSDNEPTVSELYFDKEIMQKHGFYMPLGITHSSTEKEVLAAYGHLMSVENYGSYKALIYYPADGPVDTPSKAAVKIGIETENNTVYGVYYKNTYLVDPNNELTYMPLDDSQSEGSE